MFLGTEVARAEPALQTQRRAAVLTLLRSYGHRSRIRTTDPKENCLKVLFPRYCPAEDQLLRYVEHPTLHPMSHFERLVEGNGIDVSLPGKSSGECDRDANLGRLPRHEQASACSVNGTAAIR